MKRLLTVSAILAAGAAFTVAPASAQKTYTMKIGFVTINDSNHRMASWMKKDLEAKSGGRIKVGVFPAGQLGKVPRQIEGIQLGTQESFLIPPGFFVGINRAYMVTDAPGLFDSIAHQYRAANHPPFRDRFFKLGEDKGILGNAIWSCGDTAVNTIKPFRKLADIKGLKIRVLATPLERAVMEKMGATGVPMPYTEVLHHRDVPVEVLHRRQARHALRHSAHYLRPVPQCIVDEIPARRPACDGRPVRTGCDASGRQMG